MESLTGQVKELADDVRDDLIEKTAKAKAKAKAEAEKIQIKANNVSQMFHKPMTEVGWQIYNGDALFTGSFWADFWFYFKNHSIFLAPFLQDKQNPYRRFDRFTFFLCQVAFALFLSVLFEGILFGEAGLYPTVLSEVVLGILIAAIAEINTRFIEYFGMCGCVMQRKNLPCILVCLARCCGSLVLLISLLWSFLLAGASFAVLVYYDIDEDNLAETDTFDKLDRTKDILRQFGISLLAGRVEEILILFYQFSLKRRQQKTENLGEEAKFGFQFVETTGGLVIVKVVDTVAGML